MPAKRKAAVLAATSSDENLPPSDHSSEVSKKKPIHQGLLHVFNAAKNTVAIHPKLCLQLIKLYNKSDSEEFFDAFIEFMKMCLIVEEKHPQIERTLKFVVTFTTANKKISENQDKKDADTNAEKEGEDSQAMEDDDETDEEPDPFLINMFKFLLNSHEANSNAVRYRVCQLINMILNNMGESATLDDDLFSIIYDTMLQRLMDKRPAVRVQAVLSLNRLQEPKNRECPVIKAYRFHLSVDPSSDVRRATLNSIAITFHTLPDVLQRTRDVNYLVRRQAYMVLSQKVHIKSLQISQRVRLLSEGLNDRNDSVKIVVQKNLLQAWLRFVNGNILDLLTCLDVETSTKVADLAMDTLFMDVPCATLVKNFDLLDNSKCIPIEKLKPENAFYWKTLVKHLKKEKAEEEADLLMPDLSAFCTYISAYVTASVSDDEDEHDAAVMQMERDFVMQQLLLITDSYDLSDEVGRLSLNMLVRKLLVSDKTSDSSVNFLVDIFSRLFNPQARITELAEIISDIREPPPSVSVPVTPGGNSSVISSVSVTPAIKQLTEDEIRANKVKVAKVKVQLNQCREELEDCVRSLDLDRAQELKLKLRELEEQYQTVQQLTTETPVHTPSANLREADISSGDVDDANTSLHQETINEPQEKDDPQTLVRCLTIICQMLKNVEISTMNETLFSLHDNLLLPCLKNQHALVRKLSIQSLSLLCLISKELAHKHLPLFVQISQMDVETIQVLALNAVFDIFLLLGVEDFTSTKASLDVTGVSSKVTDDTLQDETNAVLSVLSKLLESEESEVRTAVAMGLCKLLQAARINSSKLFCNLILLWFNPVTEDDQMLRHMLGVFFPLYAAYGGANQECIANAVLPTIRSLVDAPSRSTLLDIDIDDVANFLMSISSPAVVTNKKATPVNYHDSLVFTICGDILAFPDTLLCKHLSRMLKHLFLTSTNYANLRQVLALTEKMVTKVHEKPSLNLIEKFQMTIKSYLKSAPVKEEVVQEVTDVSVAPAMTTIVEEETSVLENTVDTTAFKRKRMLYSSNTDTDLLSTESESETYKTPKKKMNIDIDGSNPDLTAPIHVNNEEVINDTAENFVPQKDFELPDNKDFDKVSSEDLFASPKTEESEQKDAQTESDLFASASELEELPVVESSPAKKSRQRKKTPEVSTASSEDSEAEIITRRTRQSSTPSTSSTATRASSRKKPSNTPMRNKKQLSAVTPKSNKKTTPPPPEVKRSSRRVLGSEESSGRGVRRNPRGKPVNAPYGGGSSSVSSSPECRPVPKRSKRDSKSKEETSASPASSRSSQRLSSSVSSKQKTPQSSQSSFESSRPVRSTRKK